MLAAFVVATSVTLIPTYNLASISITSNQTFCNYDSAAYNFTNNSYIILEGYNTSVTENDGWNLNPSGGLWRIAGRSNDNDSNTLSTILIIKKPKGDTGFNDITGLVSDSYYLNSYTHPYGIFGITNYYCEVNWPGHYLELPNFSAMITKDNPILSSIESDNFKLDDRYIGLGEYKSKSSANPVLYKYNISSIITPIKYYPNENTAYLNASSYANHSIYVYYLDAPATIYNSSHLYYTTPPTGLNSNYNSSCLLYNESGNWNYGTVSYSHLAIINTTCTGTELNLTPVIGDNLGTIITRSYPNTYYYDSEISSSDVIVSVDSLNGSDKTFYVYYNDSAGNSILNRYSPDDVFYIFDDFDDGSINSSKWTYDGGVTESGGALQFSGSLSHLYPVNYGPESDVGYTIRFSSKISPDDNNDERFAEYFYPFDLYIFNNGTTYDDVAKAYYAMHFYNLTPEEGFTSSYKEAVSKIWEDSTGTIKERYEWGSSSTTITTSLSSITWSSSPSFFFNYKNAHTVYLDWVYMMPYTNYTTSVGAEETGSWTVQGDTYTHRRQINVTPDTSVPTSFAEVRLPAADFGGALAIETNETGCYIPPQYPTYTHKFSAVELSCPNTVNIFSELGYTITCYNLTHPSTQWSIYGGNYTYNSSGLTIGSNTTFIGPSVVIDNDTITYIYLNGELNMDINNTQTFGLYKIDEYNTKYGLDSSVMLNSNLPQWFNSSSDLSHMPHISYQNIYFDKDIYSYFIGNNTESVATANKGVITDLGILITPKYDEVQRGLPSSNYMLYSHISHVPTANFSRVSSVNNAAGFSFCKNNYGPNENEFKGESLNINFSIYNETFYVPASYVQSYNRNTGDFVDDVSIITLGMLKKELTTKEANITFYPTMWCGTGGYCNEVAYNQKVARNITPVYFLYPQVGSFNLVKETIMPAEWIPSMEYRKWGGGYYIDTMLSKDYSTYAGETTTPPWQYSILSSTNWFYINDLPEVYWPSSSTDILVYIIGNADGKTDYILYSNEDNENKMLAAGLSQYESFYADLNKRVYIRCGWDPDAALQPVFAHVQSGGAGYYIDIDSLCGASASFTSIEDTLNNDSLYVPSDIYSYGELYWNTNYSAIANVTAPAGWPFDIIYRTNDGNVTRSYEITGAGTASYIFGNETAPVYYAALYINGTRIAQISRGAEADTEIFQSENGVALIIVLVMLVGTFFITRNLLLNMFIGIVLLMYMWLGGFVVVDAGFMGSILLVLIGPLVVDKLVGG